MFESMKEILDAVADKRQEMQRLWGRMDDHFDDFRLKPYEPEAKGYEAYTSSRPRNFFDKLVDGVNRASMSMQIKLPDDATVPEKDAASLGELFLYAVLDYIDRRLANRAEPPLRNGLTHIMCLRGWWAIRALAYVPKGQKEMVFDTVPWDPRYTTWDADADGLLWAAHTARYSKAYIQKNWGITIQGANADVLDFYDREKNAAIIQNRQWGKDPSHKDSRTGLDHVPVRIGKIGSMPNIRTGNSMPTLEYQGDSAFAAAHGLIDPRNKWVSWIMDVAKKARVGSMTYDGSQELIGDPFESFKILPIEPGRKLSPVESPRVPPEMAAAVEIITEDWEQSTSHGPLAFGGVTSAESGRALEIRNEATRSIYSPRTGGLEEAYMWLAEEMLAQFKVKGRTTSLRTFNASGELVVVKLKPSQIKKDWAVRVKVEPRLPRDREAEILMAKASTERRYPEEIPLYSRETALEEYMHCRDPHAEEQKVLAELGRGLPPIRIREIAASLVKRGQPEIAEEVLRLLEPEPGQQQPQGQGQMQGQGQAPAQGQMQGQPPVSQPPIPPDLGRAIIEVLVSRGQADLAQLFEGFMLGQVQPTREMIAAVLMALQQAGQVEMALALAQTLGLTQGQGQGQQQVPGQAPQAAAGMPQ